MSCIFCNERGCKISASHRSCWHCRQSTGSPCDTCVAHTVVTKSLQASRGSPASPGCCGTDQPCLADSWWQLGCGRSDHREHPDESCSRNSTFSQRGDIWQRATRRKTAPIQTKHFKLLVSSQAAAVRWDGGICALSIDAGDRNTTKITAVCKPTFAATAPSPAEALHRLYTGYRSRGAALLLPQHHTDLLVTQSVALLVTP